MIKAKNKSTQQWLLHAVLGDIIGQINGADLTKITRADHLGFVAIKGGIVVAIVQDHKRFWSETEQDYPTDAKMLEYLDSVMIIK